MLFNAQLAAMAHQYCGYNYAIASGHETDSWSCGHVINRTKKTLKMQNLTVRPGVLTKICETHDKTVRVGRPDIAPHDYKAANLWLSSFSKTNELSSPSP